MIVLKLSGIQNQLPVSFGIALVCNNILKVRNYPSKNKFSISNILLHIKFKPKYENSYYAKDIVNFNI
jgi:hypothetical protein